MKKIILDNLELLFISAAGFITWLFFGRKKSNSDLAKVLQETYAGLVDDLRKEVETYRLQFSMLQEQFNQMNIAYALEVEKSVNWEKLHFELSKKCQMLKEENASLKKRVILLEKKTK